MAKKTGARPVELLRESPENPRTITDAALQGLGASMQEFGDLSGIVWNARTGRLVAGHQRMKTLRAAGVQKWERTSEGTGEIVHPGTGERFSIRVVNWDEERERAANLTANNPKIQGEFDMDRALSQLASLREMPAFEATGLAALDELLRADLGQVQAPDIGEDEIPPMPRKVITKPGDLWILGDHRLICGETRDPQVLARLMRGDVATMIHADPPYGMGKEAAGVENDNLYREKLDAFQVEWWRNWATAWAKNGSAYVWGNAPDLWRLWWTRDADLRMDKDDLLEVRNEIVWDKISAIGMRSDDMHCFPMATERCLFLMRGQQFLGNQNKDEYWEGYEPLRAWLEAERDRAGWSNKDVNRITSTQMAGHWFTRSQFYPISAENYAQLAQAAEGRAFAEDYGALFDRMFPGLRAGGNKHRRDLGEGIRKHRTYFDNTHDTMTDVWQFPRVVGEERFGHATPKPVAMVARAITSSSREGDVVAVPFAGTGPEFVAGEKLGRRVRGAEVNASYCDVIVSRWQKASGKKAVLEGRRAGGKKAA